MLKYIYIEDTLGIHYEGKKAGLPLRVINIVIHQASVTAVDWCREIGLFRAAFRCFLIKGENMHSFDIGC